VRGADLVVTAVAAARKAAIAMDRKLLTIREKKLRQAAVPPANTFAKQDSTAQR
jgi:hypothetical protein